MSGRGIDSMGAWHASGHCHLGSRQGHVGALPCRRGLDAEQQPRRRDARETQQMKEIFTAEAARNNVFPIGGGLWLDWPRYPEQDRGRNGLCRRQAGRSREGDLEGERQPRCGGNGTDECAAAVHRQRLPRHRHQLGSPVALDYHKKVPFKFRAPSTGYTSRTSRRNEPVGVCGLPLTGVRSGTARAELAGYALAAEIRLTPRRGSKSYAPRRNDDARQNSLRRLCSRRSRLPSRSHSEARRSLSRSAPGNSTSRNRSIRRVRRQRA